MPASRDHWARLVATGYVKCHRCHEYIDPDEAWEPAPQHGVEHPRCSEG